MTIATARSLVELLDLPEGAELSEAEQQLLDDYHAQAKRKPGFPTLEAYVHRTVAEAAAYADSIGEDDEPYKLAEGVVIENRRSERLKRAERYARWRYQGVLDGEIARL